MTASSELETIKENQRRITDVWFLDSGCGKHTTWNPSVFRDLTPVPFRQTFRVANEFRLQATHIGNIGSPSNRLFIAGAFLVPELRCDLVSVGQLCKQGARLTFSSSGCTIEDSTGRVVGRRHRTGNIFILDELNMSRPEGMRSYLSNNYLIFDVTSY
jgi:hypothetical protein